MADLFRLSDFYNTMPGVYGAGPGATPNYGGQVWQQPQWWQQPPPAAANAQAPTNQPEDVIPDNAQPAVGAQPLGQPAGGGGGGAAGGLGGGLMAGLGANRNAMVGLGMGLMGGGNMWNKFAGAQEGYQQGARADLTAAQQAEAVRQNAIENARKAQLLALQTGPQLVDMGTDPMGNKQYAWHTPGTTTLTPAGAGAGGGGTTGSVEPNYNEEGKDPTYLDAVRKQYGSEIAKSVEDIADGKMAGTGRNLQVLLKLAARYKEGFQQQDYLTFMQAQKSFAPGGKDAAAVKSVDQAAQHLDKLWGMIDKTSNLPIGGPVGGVINAPIGAARAALSPEYASDVAEYDRLAGALGNEMISAAKGSGSDVKGAHEAATALMSAKSAAEKRGAIKGAIDFLEGAKTALETKREAGGRGRFPLPPLLPESTQAVFDRIQSHVEGQPQAPPATTGGGGGGGTATATKVINGKTYYKRDGKWFDQ